ncbi:MAG: FHA domain-containing protein, partial [Chthoniobacterales bacterium]
LHLAGETYELRDLDSTNGTRVNGEVITSIVLRVGDRIRFGRVEACYECEMPAAQPLPASVAAAAHPAEVSARPADFANASPFPKRNKEKDALRTAVYAAAAIAVLAFLASMIALAQMHPPPLP